MKPKKTVYARQRRKIASDFNFDDYDYMLFDFDGVIVHSEHIKTDGFAQMYRPHGHCVLDKVINHHRINGGMNRYAKIKLYHKKFLGIDLSNKEVNEIAGRYSRIVFEKVLKARYVKGSPKFLETCKKYKKASFLVSATPEKEIKKIVKIKNLKRFFKEIKGSPRSKEDNIKDLISKYKIDREKAVFFGDSVNDLNAAEQNNIKFIGINYAGPRSDFKNFSELIRGIRNAVPKK